MFSFENCQRKRCLELEADVSSKLPTFNSEIEVFFRDNQSSEEKRPMDELSDQDKRIREVALGTQLLTACQKGKKNDVNRILSEITSFDTLKMVDSKNTTAVQYALARGMLRVAQKIYRKELSCLIDVCKDKDLKRFEHICEKMEKGAFRYENYTVEELTLILSTYSDLLRYNWESGRITTINLNSIFTGYSQVEFSTKSRFKRCSEGDLRDVDMRYNNAAMFKVDERTKNAVFGSQLLNACKKGNREEAFDILFHKIKNYDSLRMVDSNNRTAFSYAFANKMIDVAKEINNKKFSFLLNACMIGDLESFKSIYRQLGNSIYKHDKYTADDINLIEQCLKALSMN